MDQVQLASDGDFDGQIKLTGGHHEYNVEPDGSITGKLGELVETVMTPDSVWSINNGSDKFAADRIRKDNTVLRNLNSL